METRRLETLKQIAVGIAAQFGDKCEVVIHDVSTSHPEHTIVHIENGHVSGRQVGDGASMVVLEQLKTGKPEISAQLTSAKKTSKTELRRILRTMSKKQK